MANEEKYLMGLHKVNADEKEIKGTEVTDEEVDFEVEGQALSSVFIGSVIY